MVILYNFLLEEGMFHFAIHKTVSMKKTWKCSYSTESLYKQKGNDTYKSRSESWALKIALHVSDPFVWTLHEEERIIAVPGSSFRSQNTTIGVVVKQKCRSLSLRGAKKMIFQGSSTNSWDQFCFNMFPWMGNYTHTSPVFYMVDCCRLDHHNNIES